MTLKTASSLICLALVLGCGRAQTAKRTDQNYQVVEEGQASGVTSTINAPGETTPPMTNTAADTTTNFTLPDNPAPLGAQPPNTVAGTLPPSTATQPRVQPPPMSSSATVPLAQPKPRPQPPRTDTTATQTPPPTDTTATEAPPPTDTTKTDTTKTDTAPPPPTPPV
jgi:hypothetical protein